MKNNRIKIKRQEDNGMGIIHKKLELNKKVSQLSNRNYTQNLSHKKFDTSLSNLINKELNYSQYMINNKKKETIKIKNDSIIKNKILNENSNELSDNNLKIKDFKRKKILIFHRNKTINDVINNQRNSSIECETDRIYVHKKLQDFKLLKSYMRRNIQSARNKTKQEIAYEDSLSKDNKNKDKYNKLAVFTSRNKFFKKKHISEIENISNSISGKIKNMKYLESPIKKKKKSLFNIIMNNSLNKSLNSEEEILSQNDKKIIKNKLQDEIDKEYDDRLDNLKDYINIYSINNSHNDDINDNDYDEHKFYEEEVSSSSNENEIIIKNKNNNNNNEKIYINTNENENNDLKNGGEKSRDKGDTININKNIIINKKIILVPEEKNENKNEKQNLNKNEDNLLQSKTKISLNNIVYKKKSFALSNQKLSSRGLINNTSNIGNNSKIKNIIKNIKKLNTSKISEINRMSNTQQQFYEQEDNSKYYKDNVLNRIFKKNLTDRGYISNESSVSKRFCFGKSKLVDNIFNKINNKNQSRNKEKLNEKKEILKIEDRNIELSLIEKLNFLEIQLKLILNKIKKFQNCEKECYEFIHFYFKHNFYEDKVKLFNNTKNKELIKNNTKMEIIYLFICYDILSGKKFIKACIILKSIFCLLYDNFILLLVLTIKNNNSKEIINNLMVIIEEYMKKNKKSNIIHMNENNITEIMENNSKEILNYYKMLIDSLYKKYYYRKDYPIKFPYCIKNINIEKIDSIKVKKIISSFLFEAYKKPNNYDFVELKNFFYLFLSDNNEKNERKEISSKSKKLKVSKSKDKNLSNYAILPPIKNKYKYTLILDLDETLIYLQNNDLDQTLTLRPNIQEFLHEMKSIYELVLFSENTKNYVSPIIDIIQQNEKYFEYVLCNEFITFDKKGHEIKDLNLLGRDLKNVIAVDNVSQYYKNTDNLICIKSFFGDVNNDKKTLTILGNVLKEIQLDSEKTCDTRISINKFKYKLYPKVINTLD